MEKENVIYCDFGGMSSPKSRAKSILNNEGNFNGSVASLYTPKPITGSVVYSDFDGTVTKEDSVNKFLTLFADKKWLEVEEEWVRGEIGSRECLLRQVELVPELSKNQLNDYIDSIEIDDYFLEFYDYLKSQNTELVIVSDGFDLFIGETLKRHGLGEIKYYANTLTVQNNKLSLAFNYGNPNCKNGSGVCKCARTEIKDFCYIGDGLSDACVAGMAGTLFAKKNLKKYCDEAKIDYIDYQNFGDILGYFAEKGERTKCKI